MDMGPHELVRLVNEHHGTPFALEGALEGGTRGAWELVAPDGTRVVLKRGWGEHLGRIRPIVDALRARGYPAPRFLLGGTTRGGGSYHVVELLPGRPVARMSEALLAQVMDLVELQADVRPDTDQDWSKYAYDVVFRGESGWTEAMRAHSLATAVLLDEVARAARPFAGVQLPVADAVHGDLNASNVLAEGDRVTAVIDVAQVGKGTRALDLAILLGWEWEELEEEQRSRVLRRMAEIAGVGGATLCVAYQVINQVAFAVQALPFERVDHYVARGHRMIADLAHV